MTIAVGQRLGPYELLAPLGAGGMGVVWRARDSRLGREVAVKFLSTALAGDADAARRFEREARAAAALSHPGIVALFDVGHHEGSPYLVTELLRGETLRERLGRGPMAATATIALGRELASALAAAHAAGIVHRDVKPENVFLAPDGRAKLLDFGLASIAESGGPGATLAALTVSGMVVGTVGYLAPEQLRGERVGPAADLFALGCLLYECCTGSSPFRRESIAASLHAIANEEAPSLGDRGGAPLRVAELIARCLDKQPERRPSAAELAAALDGGVAVAPTMVVPVERPAGRRTRAAAIGVAVAGSVVAIVAAVVFLRSRDEPIDGPSAPPGPLASAPDPASTGTESRGTADDEAWKLFVRASHEWEKRGPALLLARDLFKQAVDRDPNFARAWLGLSDTYALLHDYEALSTTETFPKAKAAAERALALDPNLAGAHVNLAYIAFYFDRDWQKAEREFRAAIALAPNDAKARQWFAESLAALGRFDEALAELREAQRLDPLAPMVFAQEVWVLAFAGRTPEAIERGERLSLEFAEFGPLRAYRALALVSAGRAGEAKSLIAAPAGETVSPIHELWLAYIEAVAGESERATARLESARQRHGEAYLNAYYRSYALSRLGREPEALDALALAIERREEQVVWMKFDPHLGPLRDGPRFGELVVAAGFPP